MLDSWFYEDPYCTDSNKSVVVGVVLTQHVCLSKQVVLEGIVYKEKEKHKWA